MVDIRGTSYNEILSTWMKKIAPQFLQKYKSKNEKLPERRVFDLLLCNEIIIVYLNFYTFLATKDAGNIKEMFWYFFS